MGSYDRKAVATLALSATGLVGIATYEGYSSVAYNDGAGVQTLGFGSTRGADGSPVQPGERTTPARALRQLKADADATERALVRCLGPVALAQPEWDAYVSLAYNIGVGAFCRSTLVKKLKQTPPDYAGACRELLRWDKAAGLRLAGLTKRRQAEYALCSKAGA
ncbi:lysozyme [Rhodoferax sp.]|uniref:lysozyme n=1 Tax=Rhodoferax sp. TaxID=50421 RepID=UPI0026229781|nr:lysozyme [Rhodoferax sp.]MDD3938029.1 lysozyme [Rhodoferax sp.]